MPIDKNIKIFIAYIASLSLRIKITIYFIKEIKITILSIEEVYKSNLAKYLDFVDVFSKMSAIKLSEYSSINIYDIELEKNK